MRNKSNIVLFFLLIAALGWGVWSIVSSRDRDVADAERSISHANATKKVVNDSGKLNDSKSGRKTREIRVEGLEDVNEGGNESIVPYDADETELTELQKKILKELQEALDNNSLSGVRRAIARFQKPKSKGGLGGDVPKVMRRQAVSALGWFGASGTADMIEFMADIDPEVEQDAFSQFELALDDWDMGDRERSMILQTALTALNDSDQINALMMHLNNMRNSVKAETILAISNMGTPEAKVLMQEQIGYYTDADVDTVADLSRWRAENPDDPFDEEFYGPQKNDD